VAEGDAVKQGQCLLILEAMKMETAVPAPVAGTITRLTVKAGQQVDAKDLICQID
ncbi:MAG: biotin/lipoyl-containing protein, partial [Rhodospirillales bacterium]